jgi:hypothetical protein
MSRRNRRTAEWADHHSKIQAEKKIRNPAAKKKAEKKERDQRRKAGAEN